MSVPRAIQGLSWVQLGFIWVRSRVDLGSLWGVPIAHLESVGGLVWPEIRIIVNLPEGYLGSLLSLLGSYLVSIQGRIANLKSI